MSDAPRNGKATPAKSGPQKKSDSVSKVKQKFDSLAVRPEDLKDYNLQAIPINDTKGKDKIRRPKTFDDLWSDPDCYEKALRRFRGTPTTVALLVSTHNNGLVIDIDKTIPFRDALLAALQLAFPAMVVERSSSGLGFHCFVQVKDKSKVVPYSYSMRKENPDTSGDCKIKGLSGGELAYLTRNWLKGDAGSYEPLTTIPFVDEDALNKILAAMPQQADNTQPVEDWTPPAEPIDLEELETYVAEAERMQIDITGGYESNYLPVGYALSYECGETGRQYFHRIAALSKVYNKKGVDKQYTACLKSEAKKKGGSKYTKRTLYKLFADYGVQPKAVESAEPVVEESDEGSNVAGLQNSRKQLLEWREEARKRLNEELRAAVLPEWLQLAARLTPDDAGLGVFAALVLKTFYFPGQLTGGIPICIQAMVVGDSSSDKSIASNMIEIVTDKWRTELNKENATAYREYKKANESNKEKNAANPPPPVPHYVVSHWDFSDMALTLKLNTNRLFIYSDDLNGFLSQTKDWNLLGNVLLKLNAGKTIVADRVSTKGRILEVITAETPEATVFGCLSPEHYRDWISKNGGNHSGLLARFLIYNTLPATDYDKDHDARNESNNLILQKFCDIMDQEAPDDLHIKKAREIFASGYTCEGVPDAALSIYHKYLTKENYNNSGARAIMNRLQTAMRRMACAAGVTKSPTWLNALMEFCFICQLLIWEAVTRPKDNETRVNKFKIPDGRKAPENVRDSFFKKYTGMKDQGMSKTKIAKVLGLSRPALDKRLKTWG